METTPQEKGELILVVEDDENVREIIKFSLELAGYRVVTVHDGSSAFEKAKEVKPDIVLLDLMLPVVDGLDVCRRLKSNFQTSQIPVVILTAKRELKDKVAGMEAGADDYVTKPFNRTELLARVKMVLLRTAQQRGSNPLTGLPGNVTIEKRATELLSRGDDFALLVIDIDHFKAYNDKYGYSNGDKAIQLLAEVATETADRYGQSMFVGHVGGDDFVLMTPAESGKEIAEEIIRTYEARSKALYTAEDLARGYYASKTRTGEERQFPCHLAITIAVVTNTDGKFSNYLQMVDVATELKKHGKTIEGSVVTVNRRGDLGGKDNGG